MVLGLKNKQQLAGEAHKLAGMFNLVNYRDITYLPVDYETKDAQGPEPARTMWVPMTVKEVGRLAAATFDTLFANDGELRSFVFMTMQNSSYVEHVEPALLVKTEKGLEKLNQTGQLTQADGVFLPNTLRPLLNLDTKVKAEVFGVIEEWLGSKEEAESMLRHLATSLAPGYSAVKYVLLLGGGRNGKSTLLKMLMAVFGRENISSVTRQQIAEQSPVTCELNGKLLNVVMDGQAEYLKDSGNEKSLIAGEHVTIRKLYESTPTFVQTNALFVEGLQHEPKSKDKSTALQKRLVRYQFPNTYPEDKRFERHMLSEPIIGAFLSLLTDYFVEEDNVAGALAPTQKMMELQLEHMFVNSLALQYLRHLEEHATFAAADVLGKPVADLVPGFKSWRLSENDLGTWAEPDVIALFGPLLNTERKTHRTLAGPRKVRMATSFKAEAAAFIESLKGDEDGGNPVSVDEEAMVAE